MNKEVEKIMAEFYGFTDGIRMLMLIHRTKDGGLNNDRKAHRKLSRNIDEFEAILHEMVEKKKKSNDSYRIYSSVNPRDMKKGLRIFKQRQLDADYYNEESRDDFYFDIKNRWLSSIMSPQAKAESAFLIDVDEEDDENGIKRKLWELPQVGRNIKKFKTKNGCHFITPPFNPVSLLECKVNKDGLLLLSY